MQTITILSTIHCHCMTDDLLELAHRRQARNSAMPWVVRIGRGSVAMASLSLPSTSCQAGILPPCSGHYLHAMWLQTSNSAWLT